MAHMSRSATNQRNYRKAIAEETLDILEKGGYSSPETGDWVDLAEPLARCVEGSFVVHQGEEIMPAGSSQVPTADRLKVEVEVTKETSLEALYRLAEEDAGHIVLLNFASAKNPGGGFLGGAQAQEESLARSSGLYPCLTKFQDDMYAANKKDPRGGFYSDDMIFSSHVPFFRTDQGSLLPSPISCSVITCPAVNAGVVAEGAGQGGRRKGGTPPVMQVMEGRLRRILRLARARGGRTLILGAWGCGVFRNTPEEVAQLFRAALSPSHGFQQSFARAVFAVPDEKMQSCFARILLPTAPGRPARSAFQWDVPAPSVLPGDSPLATPTPTLQGYGLETPTSPELVSRGVDPESPPDSPESTQLVSVDLDNDQPAQRALELKLISFGYSRGGGIPTADHVFDARHIKNPQKGPQKHLTGLDARLRKEIMAHDGAEELYEKMLQVVLNDLAEERASVVAVGCTHGKHRSVTFCEELAMRLRGKVSPQGRRLSVEVWHRERGSWSKKGRWRRGAEGRGDFEGEDDDE